MDPTSLVENYSLRDFRHKIEELKRLEKQDILNEVLTEAVNHNDLEKIKVALDAGADPNAADKYQHSDALSLFVGEFRYYSGTNPYGKGDTYDYVEDNTTKNLIEIVRLLLPLSSDKSSGFDDIFFIKGLEPRARMDLLDLYSKHGAELGNLSEMERGVIDLNVLEHAMLREGLIKKLSERRWFVTAEDDNDVIFGRENGELTSDQVTVEDIKTWLRSRDGSISFAIAELSMKKDALRCLFEYIKKEKDYLLLFLIPGNLIDDEDIARMKYNLLNKREEPVRSPISRGASPVRSPRY